jgi:hypothetical protein
MGQRIDLTQQVQGILPETNGGAGPNTGLRFADAETPSGTINGVNTTFTLAHAPSPAQSVLLFMNKTLQIQGTDYTLAGVTITMSVAPPGGATFLSWYRYLGFAYAFNFQDSMAMSDALVVDAPVFSLPMGLIDSMGTLADFMVFAEPPSNLRDGMVMSDNLTMLFTYLLKVADSESANWRDNILPFTLNLFDSMTMSDGFTHS